MKMAKNQTNILSNPTRSNTVKKVLFVAFMVMAFVALGSLVAFAGGKECEAAKSADAKNASGTTTKAAGCCAHKAGTTSASATKIDATMASSKTTTANGATCTAAEKAACAAKGASLTAAGGTCTIESCLKACEVKHAEICGINAANHRLASMSIKGMTCAGCEKSVTTALMAVEGVNNVIEVCSKAGFAVVCTAKDSKLSNDSMIKAVSSKGFESEIIPAVAITTTTTNTTEKAECSAHKKDGSK